MVISINDSDVSEIAFSDEQVMLLEMSTRFARDKSSFSAVRQRLAGDAALDEEIWQEIVSMGWAGLLIPEALGGSALDIDALVPIVESSGRHLLASPLISSSLATQLLLDCATEAQQLDWLPRMAEGVIGTPALYEPGGAWTLDDPIATAERSDDQFILQGTKIMVTDADVASLFIVSAQLDGAPALFVVDAGALSDNALHKTTVYDQTQHCYKLVLDGVRIPASCLMNAGSAPRALNTVQRSGELLFSAEMCGGLAGALELILDYIKTRQAFGKAIGQFQSLKHSTVDILLSLESARSLTYRAATVMSESSTSEDVEIATRMAKAHVSDAFVHAGDRAIQFHGGIGFTYECNAQLFLRRAMWSQAMYGDARYHRQKLAPLLLGDS